MSDVLVGRTTIPDIHRDDTREEQARQNAFSMKDIGKKDVLEMCKSSDIFHGRLRIRVAW